MNAARAALYSALTGNGPLVALLSTPTAVYHERADEDAVLPYVLFQKSSGTPNRQFGASANRIDHDVWIVKGICGGESASDAEAIAAAIDTALDRQPITVSGKRTLICERQSDIDYPEDQGDVTYHHCGGLYRLWTQP